MTIGIKRISAVEHYGCFEEFLQDEDFICGENNNCNIIFGFNGSGKSTIAAILSLFSSELFLEKNEKENIFNDYQDKNLTYAELELNNKTKIKYPSNNTHNKNIYVFDKNFISSHVFTGECGKIKKFSTIKAEIRNDQINQLNKLIFEKESEINFKKAENETLKKQYKEAIRFESDIFGGALTDKNKRITMREDIEHMNLPCESLEELNQAFEKLKDDYELSKRQDQLKADIDVIASLNIEKQLNLNISNISENLKIKLNQISKDIFEAKINKIKNYFEDEIYKKSVEKWYKFGKDILSKTKDSKNPECPICETQIANKIDKLVKEYENYFDESYEEIIVKLTSYDQKLCMS